MDDVKIYRLVLVCDGGFITALETPPSKEHEPLHNALDDCYQLFVRWVKVTGARADNESNLDQRLKFSPDLQNEVARLLERIFRSLRGGFYKAQRDVYAMWDACVEGTKSAAEGEFSATNLSVLAQMFPPVTVIHGAIDELGRIMSIESRDRGCFEVAAVRWVKELHPDIPETLAEQLGISIECRRLRLLRQKKYQQGFPLEGYQYRPARLAQPEDQMVAALDRVTLTDSPVLDPALPPNDASYQQDIGSEATTSSVAQAYPHPKAPNPPEGSEYCQCKWCCNKLEVEDLTYKEWRAYVCPWNCRSSLANKLTKYRSHFDEDLQPYTCIEKRCRWPPIYFTSVDQWQKHMVKKHTSSWTEHIHRIAQHCSRHVDKEGHTDRKEFQTTRALRDHLADEHALTGTDVGCIPYRTKSPGTCLFCKFDASAKAVPGDELEASKNANVGDAAVEARESEELVRVKLWEHIGHHLRNLAFLSLKWFEEDEADMERGDGKANSAQRKECNDHDDREATSV